ncbi:GTPase HflX [Propionigenium maris DSM 9537]|uniref:GTPase HflX n=1 Tax=Propionigenium maris DSM 9537 TaxID=1123000 RepID=A0A9W6LLE7_9FUSO|nr:GTPase HflX [Propionigenium maris]GLI55231.1 GTPase HflX [Propionigenium maris DSM 9537]
MKGEVIKINFDENKVRGRAVLVALDMYRKKGEVTLEDSLNELAELAHAANFQVITTFTQSKDKPEPGTYLGKGKIEEIQAFVHGNGIDIIIFDDELGGIQIRNLNEIFETEIMDRTALILDIFASRATSKEGKLQVELASLKYQKPRLIGMGDKLSRTGAGIGTRGLGETKLELDRRNIEERITNVERALDEVKKQREVRRKQRKKSTTPSVALVGYTNAGKSTIMNLFMEMDEENPERTISPAKDMLFATLDPFHRKVKLRDNLEFILVDTVGFVSKLPHTLVEAFKSTLEEVEEADLLLYVTDIAREDAEHQLKVTRSVVEDLNTEGTPHLLVYNKIDKLDEETLEGRKSEDSENTMYISATERSGINELIDRIEGELFKGNKNLTLLIPFSRGDVSSYLLGNTKVISQEYTGEGLLITTSLKQEDQNRYKEFIVED